MSHSAASSNPEVRGLGAQIFVRRFSEGIRDEHILQSLEVQQLRAGGCPLRPRDQWSGRADRIGIQAVDEGNVVSLNRLCRDREFSRHAVCEENIASVEGSQDGCALEVRGEIAPTWDAAAHGCEVGAAGESESEVAEDCSEALKFGVDVVQSSCVEWRAGWLTEKWLIRVVGHETSDVCDGVGVVWEE